MPSAKGGLYDTPVAALADVKRFYDSWSGQLTQRSFELSMAVIAADWTVFGGMSQILNNRLAKGSVAVVVTGLLLVLLGTWINSELLREQANYAERNPERWAKELEKFRGVESAWPSTRLIDNIAIGLRVVKTFMPIFGGILFILALLYP